MKKAEVGVTIMWTGPDLNSFDTFDLTPQYRADYRMMYQVLCSEAHTRQALDALCYQLTLASTSAFLISLQNYELTKGFDYYVATVRKGLTPQAFFSFTSSGRTIDDLTFVNHIHGRSTHRIQWAMMAAYADKNPKTFTWPMSTLYKAMEQQQEGSVSVYKLPMFLGQSFWDFLLDNEERRVNNATMPEWFCGTFLKAEYPALYACSNGKEPYERK
ncbi:LirA/MavJ family T4SS effector [Novosphingobium soli]|uniref:LirA/MavJ family T4SS effector n=1 Tax=Novosphingobium soli TaxID=574956 RepID=A0ABV6CTQ7_9SPHN